MTRVETCLVQVPQWNSGLHEVCRSRSAETIPGSGDAVSTRWHSWSSVIWAEGKSYNAGKTCKKDSDLSVFILCPNSEKCAEIETFQPFKWAGQWLFKSVFNVRSHPWRAFLTPDSMERLPYFFLPFRPGWTFLCAENAQQCIFHKDKKNALHCALFSLRKVRHGLNCLCTFELCTCAFSVSERSCNV